MASEINLSQMVFTVDGVTDVIVTDSVQDPDVGDWVRDIRVFGTDKVMMFQISIRATNKQALELTAPPQQY